MKYLIKGSKVERERWSADVAQRFEDVESYRERFEAACRAIGERLARDHQLLIGSYLERTVGPHVAEGASVVGQREKRDVTVKSFQPKGEKEEQPEIEGVRFVRERNDGPWSVALLPALLASDVIIVLGGGENSRLLAVSAAAVGKPIVGVPLFGGTGEEVWEQTGDEYQTYFGVTGREARALERGWSEDTLDAVLSVADKLVRRGRSVVARLALLAAIAFLLLVWTGMLIIIAESRFLATVFLLLAVSALIGTALRMTTRLYTGRVLEVTWQDVFIDTAAGLLLAFVFFLLYLVGALAYPENVFETMGQGKGDISLRMAVVITLVGVAGAFLLDEGVERLTGYLRPFLGGPERRAG